MDERLRCVGAGILRRLGVAAVLLALSLPPWVAAASGEADAMYEAGSIALGRRDYAAAIAAFERATAADPSDTRVLLKLGIARAAIQDWTGALEAYGALRKLEPRNARALNNTANVYFRQGKHAQAAGYYRQALEIDPDYLIAAYHYGWVLRQLNRPDEAEHQFSHCLELPAESQREQRTQLDCRYYLGALRYRAEDYETAARVMEQVVSAMPSHPEARYYLAMAYRRLGRTEEARAQLELHQKMLRAARSAKPIEKQRDP